MPGTPAWIRYARDTDIPDEQAAEINTELYEASDRAVVIILGSHIEDVVQDAIMRQMISMADGDAIYNDLFGFQAALSSFSNKIKMAHALKCIDGRLFNELEILREMRNVCAHSRRPIYFSTNQLKIAQRKFVGGDRDILKHPKWKEDYPTLPDRAVFVGKCVIINSILNKHPRPANPDELLSLLSAQVIAHTIQSDLSFEKSIKERAFIPASPSLVLRKSPRVPPVQLSRSQCDRNLYFAPWYINLIIS